MQSSDTGNIEELVVPALDKIWSRLSPTAGRPIDQELDEAYAAVTFFIAVALRVMAKTKPSRIKAATRTCAIQVLIPKAGA